MVEARAKNHFPLICLVLALGTAALYWPITSHPFILYDDEQYILANPHVTSGLSWANFVWAFTSGEAANWHPLTWLSHQLDCTWFGVNAGGHHLVSLLFHVANTLLLLVFLRRSTGALWCSTFAAALFAWHPLHVESVAWASERKDVLSTFFWLLTLLAWLRYAQARPAVGINKPRRLSDSRTLAYLLALTFFACGLMSKPMVVTLPFVLLLLDLWPLGRLSHGGWHRANNLKPLVLEKLPFFILAAASSIVTYLVQSSGGAVWSTPWPERLANAAIAYIRYVAKIFCPDDLAIVYSHPGHWPVAQVSGALALLVLWTILVLRYWRQRPYLFVGWFWFLGTLVPTIGLIQVGAQSMADRYTYIPGIGFFILIAWGWADLIATHPKWRNISQIIAVGILAGCMLATSIQITYWRDNTSLFLHAMAVSPDNYLAANGLGKAFEKDGNLTNALVMYRHAVELEPRYPQGQFNYAMGLLAFGQSQEALKHLETAAALEPRNPDIQHNLGIYYAQHQSFTNAFVCFSNAVSLNPDSAVARFDLACSRVNLGQFAAALPDFRQALHLQPDFTEARAQLNQLLAAHPELH
jgi:tetratricopeptide (TPR) repeat protein